MKLDCARNKKIPVTVVIEVLTILVLAVAVFFSAALFDTREFITEVLDRYERWELDEILTVSLFLSFVLGLYAVRQWRRLLAANKAIEFQNRQLRQTLAEIRRLQGIVPICAYCKNVRDDQGYWQQVEKYVSDHSDAKFSHGICPDCKTKFFPDLFEDVI